MTEEAESFPLEHLQLRERVSRQELTPDQAEDEARTRGLAPFVKYITQPAEELHSLEWWPLALGIIWITRRNMSDVVRRWAEFKVWKRDLWLNDWDEERHIRLHDAEPQLWHALEGGKVQAAGNDAEFKKRVEIPALEWKEMRWDDLRIMTNLHNVYESKYYSKVDVRKRDVLEVWPEILFKDNVIKAKAVIDKVDSESTPKNRGGRTAVHDWPALAGYLAAYVVDNDYPQQQSKLVDVATGWFGENLHKIPDKRDVERFVRTMYGGRRISGKT